MLQVLISNKDTEPSYRAQGTSRDAGVYTPQSMIDEQVPALESVQEGYHGDSSFTSLAHQIKTTLEATLLPSELDFPLSVSLEDTGGQGMNEDTAATPHPTIHPTDVGLGTISLPPNEIVLKLLRLVKTKEQRFFVDMPLFDQDEFITMCRDIYFPTEPISLWTWICVNVGLYSLFSDIGTREVSCRRLGTTVDAMRGHTKILRANAEAALRSLRMCSEPSTESCRALAVLVHNSCDCKQERYNYNDSFLTRAAGQLLRQARPQHHRVEVNQRRGQGGPRSRAPPSAERSGCGPYSESGRAFLAYLHVGEGARYDVREVAHDPPLRRDERLTPPGQAG